MRLVRIGREIVNGKNSAVGDAADHRVPSLRSNRPLRVGKALIEQHARIAVIPVECQNKFYEPTPYEANAMRNMRHILSRFADALLAVDLLPGEEGK